jgi:hypothetical protein
VDGGNNNGSNDKENDEYCNGSELFITRLAGAGCRCLSPPSSRIGAVKFAQYNFGLAEYFTIVL